MKLISLNTFGGKYFEPLTGFIKQNSQNTDIFCFQEMNNTNSDIKQYNEIRTNLLSEINQILPGFKVFYFPVVTGFDYYADPVNFDLSFGQAIFIRLDVKINSQENYLLSKKEDNFTLKKDFSNLPTPLQYLSFIQNKKEYTLFNFHGTPMPGDKLDTKRRLTEVAKAKEIIESKKGTKILVGDFNLLPETKSIKIFESNMRNLIKEFKIQRTRSKLSPFYGKSDFQKFADYTFVSNDVEVKSFEVLRVEISDHLPMILEFA